jgi:tetratricopeptide (TPR) repeat protein
MKQAITLFLCLFTALSFAQAEKKEEKIKKISEEACACIAKIDLDKSKKEKSEDIKTCIQSVSMAYQIENSLLGSLEKAMETVKSDGVSKTDSTAVTTDKNIVINVSENYEEIEEYLYDNCSALKAIYFTDNTESENSKSDKKKALKYYDKGQSAFANQNYVEAVVQFSKAVKKDKKFAFAWDNLGYSYRKLENYKQAIKSYKKSLEIDPKGKMPLMNIAVAYQLDNDLENAIASYKNYRDIYENDPEGFYGLGRIYYFQKDFEPALVNMIKAYRLYTEMKSPYNIDAQKHIGFIYQEMKQLDQLEDFNRITKENNLDVNFEE